MQETTITNDELKWLAGFTDVNAEIRINRHKRKRGKTYHTPVLIISSNDHYVMDYVIDLTKKRMHINSHVTTSKTTTNRKSVKYIEVRRLTKIRRLCKLLSIYSITKHDELLLLANFCSSRIKSLKLFSFKAKNKNLPSNDYEIGLYNALVSYKLHRRGQRCLRYEPIYSDTMNTINWPWLAGFIDATKCFNINKKGNINICLTTNHITTSNLLSSFLKANSIEFQYKSSLPSASHSTICKFRIHSYIINDYNSINTILSNIESYVFAKSNLVNTTLTYLDYYSKNKDDWDNKYKIDFLDKVSVLI